MCNGARVWHMLHPKGPSWLNIIWYLSVVSRAEPCDSSYVVMQGETRTRRGMPSRLRYRAMCSTLLSPEPGYPVTISPHSNIDAKKCLFLISSVQKIGTWDPRNNSVSKQLFLQSYKNKKSIFSYTINNTFVLFLALNWILSRETKVTI